MVSGSWSRGASGDGQTGSSPSVTAPCGRRRKHPRTARIAARPNRSRSMETGRPHTGWRWCAPAPRTCCRRWSGLPGRRHHRPGRGPSRRGRRWRRPRRIPRKRIAARAILRRSVPPRGRRSSRGRLPARRPSSPRRRRAPIILPPSGGRHRRGDRPRPRLLRDPPRNRGRRTPTRRPSAPAARTSRRHRRSRRAGGGGARLPARRPRRHGATMPLELDLRLRTRRPRSGLRVPTRHGLPPANRRLSGLPHHRRGARVSPTRSPRPRRSRQGRALAPWPPRPRARLRPVFRLSRCRAHLRPAPVRGRPRRPSPWRRP